MVFPIAAGNESKRYEVENSLRFNDDDGPELKRTPSSAGDRKTFTTSFWVKRGNLGTSQRLWSAGTSIGTNNNNVSSLLFETNDTLKFFGEINQNPSFTLQTSQVFRDVSAWYHIVLVVDTTQSTSSNRVKIYVNGNQVTDFGTETYMSQDVNTFYNADNLNMLSYGGSGGKIDGYIAEFVNIDGTALTQTSFGEFDDNGVWIPIDVSGLDFSGTNSCHLEFKQTGTSQNSSGIGADTSGNDNHFAVTNLAATDVTEDTCTNNFVTLNPITPVVTHTLSEGNCKSTNSSGTHGGTSATINLPKSGKWYWEVKIEAESSDKGQGVGIGNQIYRSASDWGNYPNMVIYLSDGTKQNESGYASYGNAHNADDIIGVAYNADDQELTFYHNNSSQGTIPTSEMDGEIDFDNVSIIVFGRNVTQSFNFGNPPYSISSGNTDGKYGNFEYAPPSGYYALCTKRLAVFG